VGARLGDRFEAETPVVEGDVARVDGDQEVVGPPLAAHLRLDGMEEPTGEVGAVLDTDTIRHRQGGELGKVAPLGTQKSHLLLEDLLRGEAEERVRNEGDGGHYTRKRLHEDGARLREHVVEGELCLLSPLWQVAAHLVARLYQPQDLGEVVIVLGEVDLPHLLGRVVLAALLPRRAGGLHGWVGRGEPRDHREPRLK